MLYLIAAIIFGSMFSVVFKICQEKNINSNQVILFNYVTAAFASLIPIGLKLWSGSAVPADYSLETDSCLLAILQGALFEAGFIIMDRCVWRSGVALTTVSARASLILPVILSWWLLGQSAPAVLPVILVLVALVLIVLPAENVRHDGVKLTSKTDAQRKKRTMLALTSVFLCYGVSDFGVKFAQNSVAVKMGAADRLEPHLDSLMGLIFIAASIFALVVCIVNGDFRKSRVGWKSILGGAALGFVNILCTSSSLRALSAISTSIYFPVYNIGIVLMGTIMGIILFKEKVKWLQFLGIGLSVAAILIFFS